MHFLRDVTVLMVQLVMKNMNNFFVSIYIILADI